MSQSFNEFAGVDTMVSSPLTGGIKAVTVDNPDAHKLIATLQPWYTAAWSGGKLPERNIWNYEKDVIDLILDQHVKADFLDFNPNQFPYRYWTAGCSEAIKACMLAAANSDRKTIYVLEGDYDGYGEAVRLIGCGLRFVTVKLNQSFSGLEPGLLFISSPSTIDGRDMSWWIQSAIDAGHEVFHDMVYLGMNKKETVVLPGVNAFAFSISKPFSMFNHRAGFILSTVPIPALEGNVWFKSVSGIVFAEMLMNHLNLRDYHNAMTDLQMKAIAEIKRRTNVVIKPGNVWIHGLMDREDPQVPDLLEKFPDFAKFQRGKDGIFRFSLGPAMLAIVQS